MDARKGRQRRMEMKRNQGERKRRVSADRKADDATVYEFKSV